MKFTPFALFACFPRALKALRQLPTKSYQSLHPGTEKWVQDPAVSGALGILSDTCCKEKGEDEKAKFC